jgi:predicted RND superfamily exporter protein
VCGSLALIATAALLLLDFRAVPAAAAALFPVVPAVGAMVLVSVATGIDFSFLALFAVVMLVGIGVDYGVHIVHRCRASAGDANTLAATGRAVLLAAATTVGGFGSLVFSSFPGLRAVGLFVATGVVVAALAALTATPGLVRGSRRADVEWPPKGGVDAT